MSELVDVLIRELVRRPDAIAELAAALVPELERHGLAPKVEDEQEWLSLAEAGRRLGVSADAVRMQADRGRLRDRRLGRRRYVFAEHEGLIEPLADLGERVGKDEAILRVWPVTHTGADPLEYRAKRDGMLAARHFPGLVKPGDCVAVVAVAG